VFLLATAVSGLFREKLFQSIIEDHANKNYIVSPLCVEIGMSMILMGAKGKTADELRSALNLPEDKKEVARTYDKLLSNFKHGRMLYLVNRLYVNEPYRISKDYNKLVSKSFRAEAEAINLADAAKAAWSISNWVLYQTLDHVKAIITPSNVAPDESAVLVNAAFIKGYWKTGFRRTRTTLSKFILPNFKTVNVRMMSQVGKFRMSEFLYGQVLELPFDNSNLSMIIGLPAHTLHLRLMEMKIKKFAETLKELDVHIQLPKFGIEFRTDLVDILKKVSRSF